MIDKSLEIASGLALSTSGTGLALVGDQIPLGSVNPAIGLGRPLWLVIQIATTVTSGGSATVEFDLVSDAQAAIAVDGSATVHLKTMAFPKATLVKGFAIAIPIPPEFPAWEQYLGLLQNVGVAALTAGAVNAFVTDSPQKWHAFPDPLTAP